MQINPIDSTNQTSFQAKVNKRFSTHVYNYCTKRILPIQVEKFEKKLSEIRNYGRNNSEFMHSTITEGGKKSLIMVFKNEKINPKEGLVVFKSDKFCDLINYFIKVGQRDIENYEKSLMG